MSAANIPRRRFRFRLIVEEEYQPLSIVPFILWVMAAFMLAAQIYLSGYVIKEPEAKAEAMQFPPSEKFLRSVSFGSPLALSRILMFRLQAFDNQPGISLPYASLDYGKIREWLEVIQDLNPKGAYPLMTAARVYSEVRDPQKKRIMFEFVYEKFLEDPNGRWEWLAHVATLTKEKLGDLDLALAYAKDLRELTTPEAVPGWARQLEVFYRESNSEYDISVRLIEELLESGEVTDQYEFTFLFDKLSELIEKAWRQGQIKSEEEFDAKLRKLDALRQRYFELHEIDGSE